MQNLRAVFLVEEVVPASATVDITVEMGGIMVPRMPSWLTAEVTQIHICAAQSRMIPQNLAGNGRGCGVSPPDGLDQPSGVAGSNIAMLSDQGIQ